MSSQSPDIPPSRFLSEEYNILYDYWDEIPVVNLLPYDRFQVMESHHYRGAMVAALRRGIVDPSGRRRHALSLKELSPLVESYIHQEFKTRETVKLTALYHHRDILLEEGLVKEVATILEGKRYVTYYGRTAKAYIGDDNSDEKTTEQIELLRTLLLAMNPDKTPATIDPILSQTEEKIKEAHLASLRWLEDHVDLINQLDLDAIYLYQILAPLFVSQSQAESEIKELLDIS